MSGIEDLRRARVIAALRAPTPGSALTAEIAGRARAFAAAPAEVRR